MDVVDNNDLTLQLPKLSLASRPSSSNSNLNAFLSILPTISNNKSNHNIAFTSLRIPTLKLPSKPISPRSLPFCSQSMNVLLSNFHFFFTEKARLCPWVNLPFFQNLLKRTNLFQFKKPPIFCSSSLSLTTPGNDGIQQLKSGGGGGKEERVLISEVLVRNKDGEELERKDLENEVVAALKACRPNSALTVNEVQEDVLRIIDSGYFFSCMPAAVDTRDGIRLVFQNQIRNSMGKIINIRRLDEVINSINGWYMERGLFGLVSDVEILSGGILRMQVSEAEVNNITIRFLDRKTGEPTTGKTKPETILRQLTTKKGQVYSLQQGTRDVETVLAMGIMEDVSVIPQPAGGRYFKHKLDMCGRII